MTVQEYLRPGSLSEAVGLLERHGASVTVMAGGTVVMPLVNEGAWLPERVMSVRNAGIDAIDEREGELAIGAGATLTQLLAADRVPLLSEAVRNTASWSIRNLATVGGNLFTHPKGGDVAVALLALDARVRLVGPSGERIVPLAEFYGSNGSPARAANELVAEILVPLAARETAFLKFARKQDNSPTVVTVAVAIERRDGRVAAAHIALGAVGPHPMRATGAEAAILGTELDAASIDTAAEAATAECRPPTDAIASEWYRRRMAGVFVRRALAQLAQERRDGAMAG